LLNHLIEADLALAEFADRDGWAVDRQWRNDDVDAAAVQQTGVAKRARLVDTPSDAADDAVADVEQMAVVLERDRGEFELAAFLDVYLLRTIDHDVGDAFVLEQRLEGTKAQHVVDDLLNEVRLLRSIELNAMLDQQLTDYAL